MLYAYAVTRDDEAVTEALATVTGVVGEPVRAVRHEGLLALVGPVPAAQYDEGALRANLEDLAWLERTARAHQRVIDAVAAAAPCVLPLRLATVYREERGVHGMLAAGGPRLGAALDRLEGRAEWGVKVHTLPQGPPAAGPPPSAPRAPASGRDYLRQRAAQRRAHEGRSRQADEAARGIHTALTALAEETRLYPAQNAGLSRQPGHNVLNAAYLVPGAARTRFTSAVARLAESAPAEGVRVELTGPWAPYSFVGPVTEDPGTT
ncbi:gas vesicle protein [Streptomyces cinnamoneus]|uniref:Gas vesicle protein n=1 Tax=Streptomyces cinnamoneus TaxID=53446 RepID=A0A2G1XP52_STRCJ|nr:gas vesicle protein [Streptomyces cinnamoneus]PPT11515.1 gas vesicle protein [Streptomyces cinnamoneus]